MFDSPTRRQYLIGTSGVIATGVLLTNKTEKTLERNPKNLPYQIQRNAQFQTAEPVVTDTNVSIDSPYPDSYTALVRTRGEADDRYRIENLKEEYDTDVSDLYTVDYETQFIAIVGYVLPRTRRLNLSSVKYEDGTLSTTHEITDSRSDLDGLKIHHNLMIYRQQGHEPPEEIDANFCIK